MPRPSGVETTEIEERDLWEDISLPPWLEDFIDTTRAFVTTYWIYLILGVLFLGLGIFILKRLRRREKNLKRLWLFILFFLSKRQMMIPLVYTLAQRDNILDETVMKNLLKIRDKCRKTSLKKHPMERLALEKEVSQALYDYFSTLEAQNRIRAGSKFEKIVQDLEFIDGKLVELQELYNQEGDRWNRLVDNSYTKLLFRIFLFRPFELFVEKE